MDSAYWIFGVYLSAGALIGLSQFGEFQAEGRGWFHTISNTLITVFAGPILLLLVLLIFTVLSFAIEWSLDHH